MIIMTIRELINLLEQYDGDLKAVADLHENDNLKAYEVVGTDNGWEPSGVISIVLGRCIME